MSATTESSKVNLPAIPVTVPAEIQSKFNIALTTIKFQELADEAHKLVFNADNVNVIKDFLKKGKDVENKIIETHEVNKAPHWAMCKNYDNAKNAFLLQKSFVFDDVQRKYTDLCKQIEREAQIAEQERQRKANIKQGIETNAVNFAKQIAECTTTAQLTRIESTINLEKTRKEKYQEFLDEAIDRYSQLNAILKTQKETVKELEKLEEQRLAAKKAGDDARLLQIQQEQEKAETKMEETKVNVQETAIAQTMNTVIEPEVIVPTVKARRSVWKYEVVDIKETVKKMPHWTLIEPDYEKIDDYLKAKKAEGITGEEFTTAGIRFYLDKTF